jgi:hypothetical protein
MCTWEIIYFVLIQTQQGRQLLILAMKVANWIFQMSSDVIIKFLGVFTISSKG